MSIRPIDMMMMPNKSQETSILQHQENQKLQQEQHYQQGAYQNNVRQDGERTVQRAKPENEEFRYKDRKNGSSGGSGNNKKKKEDKEKDGKPEKTGGFDVRI